MVKKMRSLTRRFRGRGLTEWLSKAGKWIKDNKFVSRGLSAVSNILPPGYSTVAKTAGSVAGALGYGRRRRHIRGSGIGLAGGSLRLAGGYYRR